VTHPLLYQINTRVFLQERGVALNRAATLEDIPDALIDDVAGKGFEWVWLLGVWQTGRLGREISLTDPKLQAECLHDLPDMKPQDVSGSPFAITEYRVHSDFGGDKALARVRERLAKRGLKLLLDFVPNHTARDHHWVSEHPEYYIHGSEDDREHAPQNFAKAPAGRGARGEIILAYGRDPYFAGWPDTFQLNYRHAGFREAQIAELGSIAQRCDGVRCDMAMLLQPQIIQKTWGDLSRPSDGSTPKDNPFWLEAIPAIKRRHPQFTFIAEVYWDMEWELQQAGFDFTYDKRLYDRLVAGWAMPVREHLMADEGYQDRSLRFLENHDEPRAAATFLPPIQKAAAVAAFTARGMRFFHEGQLDGRRVHVSMHLGRRPWEAPNEELRAFYGRLFDVLKRAELHEGEWQLAPVRTAWQGNATYQQLIVSSWQSGDRRLLVAVNYGGVQAQGYVGSGMSGLRGKKFTLVDLMGDERYERSGDDIADGRLYLDMPPWGYNVFDLAARD